MEVAMLEAGALLAAGIVLSVLAVATAVVIWTWRRIVVTGRSGAPPRADAIVVLGAQALPDRPSRGAQRAA